MKRKTKNKERRKECIKDFFPMKEEIITAYVYVTNRVLSARTKISVECPGLPIKEDRMGSIKKEVGWVKVLG